MVESKCRVAAGCLDTGFVQNVQDGNVTRCGGVQTFTWPAVQHRTRCTLSDPNAPNMHTHSRVIHPCEQILLELMRKSHIPECWGWMHLPLSVCRRERLIHTPLLCSCPRHIVVLRFLRFLFRWGHRNTATVDGIETMRICRADGFPRLLAWRHVPRCLGCCFSSWIGMPKRMKKHRKHCRLEFNVDFNSFFILSVLFRYVR